MTMTSNRLFSTLYMTLYCPPRRDERCPFQLQPEPRLAHDGSSTIGDVIDRTAFHALEVFHRLKTTARPCAVPIIDGQDQAPVRRDSMHLDAGNSADVFELILPVEFFPFALEKSVERGVFDAVERNFDQAVLQRRGINC